MRKMVVLALLAAVVGAWDTTDGRTRFVARQSPPASRRRCIPYGIP
jgi:hypothetical protein